MPTHFADRLMAAVREKGAPACVGIDPIYDRLPAEIGPCEGASDPPGIQAAVDAVVEFGRRIIRIVAPHVPAVKINSAFFEQYYEDGVRGYYELVREAASAGLIVIGDVKRGDIGHSSRFYAAAHLGEPGFADTQDRKSPDAVTVNPYLGIDGIAPFLDIARQQSKGLFALVLTSNESASQLQGMTLQGGMTVGQHVASLVNEWAGDEGLMGEGGYSCLGAVVSPRNQSAAANMRALMPRCTFLVPGFGAQGRTVEQIRACFKSDGTGALVTASRSVIYAYQQAEYRQACGGRWEQCVEQACRDLVTQLQPLAPGKR